MRESAEGYDNHRFEVYIQKQLGRIGWDDKETMDNCRLTKNGQQKEKIKVIVAIGQYYRERFELVRHEPGLIEQMKRMDFFKRSSC